MCGGGSKQRDKKSRQHRKEQKKDKKEESEKSQSPQPPPPSSPTQSVYPAIGGTIENAKSGGRDLDKNNSSLAADTYYSSDTELQQNTSSDNKASSAISDNNSWAGSSTFDDFKSSEGLQEKKSNHGGFRLDSHFTAPDSNEEGLRFATLINKLLII